MFGSTAVASALALVIGGFVTLIMVIWRAFSTGKAVKGQENDYDDAKDYIATIRRLSNPPDPDIDDDEWLRRHAERDRQIDQRARLMRSHL